VHGYKYSEREHKVTYSELVHESDFIGCTSLLTHVNTSAKRAPASSYVAFLGEVGGRARVFRFALPDFTAQPTNPSPFTIASGTPTLGGSGDRGRIVQDRTPTKS
jgi:hypothetical protein